MGKPVNYDHRLAVSAGAITVALTGAGFALSYDHLHKVAAGVGNLGSVSAWAWPATIDAFILIGELLVLRSMLKKSHDWFAYGLVLAGTAGSIAMNVAGVGTSRPLMEYVVAGIPPTAAFLAFAALMKQVYTAISKNLSADTVDSEPEVSEPERTVEIPAQRVSEPERTADSGADTVETVADTAADTVETAPDIKPEPPTLEDVKLFIKQLEADGVQATGKLIGEHFGVSGRTGQRYLKRLEVAA